MKKILIEASALEQDKPTGVNYFTEGISSGLNQVAENKIEIGYFWLNFLGRKKPKNNYTKLADSKGLLKQIRIIPQKVYAKLVYLNVAPPLLLPKADWLFFPNFYIWPTVKKVKKAVIIHDLCFMRYPEYVEDKNRQFLESVAVRSIKKADLIVSNSKFTTSELVSLAKVPLEKIITIDIPVDSDVFDKKNDLGTERLRRRYGIKKPYLLSFGTLEPRKNLNMLVDAYCALPENLRQRYSLVLAGKWGWKTEDLRRLIDQKVSEGFDIITTGHVDHGDRTTFFRNASYFSITTHYEGFGMPLLEALHCGIPTVAVDIPVLREVGGDSCIWAKKEAGDIAIKIEQIMSDKNLSKQLSKKAIKQSSAFSWDKTAKQLRDRMIND